MLSTHPPGTKTSRSWQIVSRICERLCAMPLLSARPQETGTTSSTKLACLPSLVSLVSRSSLFLPAFSLGVLWSVHPNSCYLFFLFLFFFSPQISSSVRSPDEPAPYLPHHEWKDQHGGTQHQECWLRRRRHPQGCHRQSVIFNNNMFVLGLSPLIFFLFLLSPTHTVLTPI